MRCEGVLGQPAGWGACIFMGDELVLPTESGLPRWCKQPLSYTHPYVWSHPGVHSFSFIDFPLVQRKDADRWVLFFSLYFTRRQN